MLHNNKTAFYPCCATDTSEPRIILRDYVQEIVFCDIKPFSLKKWDANENEEKDLYPKCSYKNLDAMDLINGKKSYLLPVIDVLIYRRDGMAEGGSGVPIWSDCVLPYILNKFPDKGALIFTDGSNDLDRNFFNIINNGCLYKFGWIFQLKAEQLFESSYNLKVIQLERDV